MKKTMLLVLVGILALAFIVVACGDDEDSGVTAEEFAKGTCEAADACQLLDLVFAGEDDQMAACLAEFKPDCTDYNAEEAGKCLDAVEDFTCEELTAAYATEDLPESCDKMCPEESME